MSIEALRESIAVWKEKLTWKEPQIFAMGTRYCPLCQLYHRHNCNSCPIKEYTGHVACMRTPYDEAYSALKGWWRWRGSPHSNEMQRRWKEACQAEIDFLEEVLTHETGVFDAKP